MKGAQIAALAAEHIADIMKIEEDSNGSPWTRASFEQEIGHALSVFIVARVGGKVIGYAGAWVVADECHVTTIAVTGEHRKKGLGKRMMVELIARAQKKGAVCATLEVRAGNAAALAMYSSLGFCSAGLRKAYYPDNREDAVIMWRNDLEGIP